MKIIIGMTAAWLLTLVTLLAAQPHQHRDPVAEHIFAPELVMQNQKAIALTAEQKKAIRNEIRASQAEFTDLQWKLEDEMEVFTSLLSKERIDEQRALKQLDNVLAAEAKIKRTHLTLAIRIKNILTPEQQAKLQELKNHQE